MELVNESRSYNHLHSIKVLNSRSLAFPYEMVRQDMINAQTARNGFMYELCYIIFNMYHNSFIG